jgi:GrpB-like predicted nucleotidyltransferase (UPF0157 family)
VPGLAAKPIIDLDVIVRDADSVREAIARLASLGYTHQGDLGIPGREAFRRADEDVPRDGSGRRWPRHNLYVCAAGAEPLLRHLCFRDWLRVHPDDAAAYAALKNGLAERFRDDREAYTDAKSPFIQEILRKAQRSLRKAQGSTSFDDA